MLASANKYNEWNYIYMNINNYNTLTNKRKNLKSNIK